MASSSSSSSATIPKARRYDVFLSFRGDDTRNGFTSHLHEALCKNQILTFFDNNLERGDNISPSLLTAIEESNISVIIFSEDYANSRWCLQELIKIFECKERNGQIVIPVFYGVDPSHVRKQIGNFGANFDKLKERLREGEMDLNEVRSHLEEAANISGWNSHDNSPESELIKSIVGDILKKLNQMPLKLPSSLVGIGSQVKLVESLLCLESPQFRMVGLWGMGGIGKTTIARAVFKHICSRFDAFHFVENVSNELRNQSVDGLREKIVLKLLEEESLNVGHCTLRHDFIMKQYQRKKVLIVLDDVDDAIKTKKLLAGENDLLFSVGSRVLLRSRDKQVLKNIVGDQNQIYEVEGLNEEDGLRLFNLYAFKQNHPTSDRLELSRRVLSYARGNPLALIVLGCALFDKSKEEWCSALDELGEEPFPDIQKVLRISYDALCDEEKMIFLDIVSFLVEKKLDFVVAYYKGFVKRIEYKIGILVDRSLITIAKDEQLEMHDLLKEMGRSIESAKRPEERTRIWNLKDITIISKKRKRSLMIEAININLSQVERISGFDCSVFARLDCLRYLHFKLKGDEESKVRFCWEEFGGFLEELKYFRWDGYPRKSLGSNFCAENLIELHMQNSTIRKLWPGKQNIVNLKVINLNYAKKLVEFPDVSEGTNIQEIHLYCCESLVKLPPSIQHLPKLEHLNLAFCLSVESVPTTFDSKVLEVINLRHCGGVKMFPQVASQGNIIRELCLNSRDIREVPSSVELLKGLKDLSMRRCKKLSIISTNICKLKSLSELDLRDCTNLESFPEIMEPMESLARLDLSGCTRLKRLPNDHSFHNLKSLEELHLDDTAITELPSSIQHLICLKHLGISGCQNLTSLPKLPSSLETLDANGCVSLKTISSACFASESKTRILKFANCFKLDEEERRRVLDIAFSNLQSYLYRQETLKEQRESLKSLVITQEPRIALDFAQYIQLLDIGREILKSLDIARERLKGLDMAREILKSLDIARERLKGLDMARKLLKSLHIKREILKTLDMARERVKSLDMARELLKSLDMAWELLMSLDIKRELLKSLDIAREILKTLDMARERVKSLDMAREILKTLDMAWERVKSLAMARELLKSLDIKRESLKSLVITQDPRIALDFAQYARVCTTTKVEYNFDAEFEIMLPWSEIPQWFCGSQSVGSSLTLKLPMDDQCYRFAFCVVIKPNYANSVGRINMYCHVDDDDDWVTTCEFKLEPSDIEHLLLWYHPEDNEWRKYFGREVSLQFGYKKGNVEVTKCGVLILSVEDIRNAESYS